MVKHSLKKEEQYIEKAFRIEEKKKVRENRLQEELSRRKKEYIEKKKKQDEEYQKKRKEEQKIFDEFAEQIEQKGYRTQEIMSVCCYLSLPAVLDEKLREDILERTGETEQRLSVREQEAARANSRAATQTGVGAAPNFEGKDRKAEQLLPGLRLKFQEAGGAQPQG